MSPDPTSRRRFLQRGVVTAAAAGGVWIAPSVLSVDLAGAQTGTCLRSVLDWSCFTNNSQPSSVTKDGVTIGIGGVDNSGVATAPNFAVQRNTFGGRVDYWQLRMTASASGQFMTATFTFSPAVTGLSFEVLDIDRDQANPAPDSWQDVLTITANPGAVAPTVLSQGPRVSGTTPNFTGNGTANLPDTSTAGNLRVQWNGSVSSVTIRYAAGDRYSIAQRVGIHDLSWCARTGPTAGCPTVNSLRASALASNAARWSAPTGD